MIEFTRSGRPFDKTQLTISTCLKDALINELVLKYKEQNNKELDKNSKLYVDKKSLTIEQLTNKNFEVTKTIKGMYNILYHNYADALASLVTLKIIGKALSVDLISQDKIIDYWNCASFADLEEISDKILEASILLNIKNFEKSELFIDLITTKAINQKIGILIQADHNYKAYRENENIITNIILKKPWTKVLDKENSITYSTPPYSITNNISRKLSKYYYDRIIKLIRGTAESEGSYGK